MYWLYKIFLFAVCRGGIKFELFPLIKKKKNKIIVQNWPIFIHNFLRHNFFWAMYINVKYTKNIRRNIFDNFICIQRKRIFLLILPIMGLIILIILSLLLSLNWSKEQRTLNIPASTNWVNCWTVSLVIMIVIVNAAISKFVCIILY